MREVLAVNKGIVTLLLSPPGLVPA